ncbi:hypothetical protein [Photobacterium leiognathi]|uniref:hypothetical protein n=1 Tax=Photobacterium leiognathi TaxID=553611 RepID=UPI000D153174|nr:hypothetical protein [Photobacterium leiognathi]PSW53035.1 hypothetical protein C0W50_19700 [Photobacterium leiognathi subsp. mandapamensis]
MKANVLLTACEHVSEWRGRVIAYIGGGGVSLFSHEVAASVEQTSVNVHELSFANWISLGGLAVVVCRLAFDIYVHFEKKRQSKGDSDNGPSTAC